MMNTDDFKSNSGAPDGTGEKAFPVVSRNAFIYRNIGSLASLDIILEGEHSEIKLEGGGPGGAYVAHRLLLSTFLLLKFLLS